MDADADADADDDDDEISAANSAEIAAHQFSFVVR